MRTWKKVAVAAALSALAAVAGAETLADAKTMLAAAQSVVAAKGMDGAAAEFNGGGKWKTGKAYVVLVDFKGNMYAHSDNPKIVGKNMFEAKDASGKPFVQETIHNVQSKGESLIDFRWSNPSTKKIDNGHFIARRVPGQDAYVGVPFFD
jgi:signal transduction histidine kinase